MQSRYFYTARVYVSAVEDVAGPSRKGCMVTLQAQYWGSVYRVSRPRDIGSCMRLSPLGFLERHRGTGLVHLVDCGKDSNFARVSAGVHERTLVEAKPNNLTTENRL